MHSPFLRTIRLTGILTAVLSALVITAGAAHGQAPTDGGPVKIRIEVNDSGFAGQGGDFTVEVEQGRLVEMTFVWAHAGYVQEEHIMVLDMGGQKLEWDKINFEHREAAVQFIADKPGTFDFKCDLQCDLHDILQKGHLKVTHGGGNSAAPAFTPTKLTVTPSSWVTAGGPVSLMATLIDAKGKPVPKAYIKFSMKVEFAGVADDMELGTARTDANGVAFREFIPTLTAEKYPITARFDGLGTHDGSEQAVEIESFGPPPVAYIQQPAGLENVRHLAIRGLAGGAITIWSVFAFVLVLAVSAVWPRSRKEM